MFRDDQQHHVMALIIYIPSDFINSQQRVEVPQHSTEFLLPEWQYRDRQVMIVASSKNPEREGDQETAEKRGNPQ
jgi:hypothetical protein